MARPPIYDVKPDALLGAITAAYAKDVSDVENELARLAVVLEGPRCDGWYDAFRNHNDLKRLLADFKREGIPYDLPRFAGCDLTPSHRIRVQTVIRQLEAEGKVAIKGVKATFIKPTEGTTNAP